MAAATEDVYATLVMSDSYLPGAAVLSHSLREAGTKKKLACLITLDTLAPDTITQLRELYDYLIPVERIANRNPRNLYLMGRPDLLFAFTKIALWRQTQFRKIVYLDADVVALRAPDELFNIEAPFAAAPDIGWPDAFNSGVMVIKPDMGDFWALNNMAESGDSFDGADQGLLNQYYENKNWHRISFTYNCTPNAEYQWEPAYRYYKSRISMVHFIGKDKPWKRNRGSSGGSVHNELLARWYAVYDKHVAQPKEDKQPSPQQEQANYGPAQPHKQVDSQWLTNAPNRILLPQQQQKHQDEPSTDGQEQSQGTHDDSGAGQSQSPQITDSHEIKTEQQSTQHDQHQHDQHQHQHQHDHEQPPPVQRREFSAPQAEWDATRFAPPPESKPEASNFPHQTYEFNNDKELFHAPKSYPEPPKDMWYEPPQSKPTPHVKPKPIFPWEVEREQPAPTRVFDDDFVPEPTLKPEPEVEPERDDFFDDELGVSAGPPARQESSPSPHRTPTPESEPFAPTGNVWDAVPGIERYVRAVQDAQQKRTTKSGAIPSPGAVAQLLSPTGQTQKNDRKQRRESLILTDFPSAIERPSLPVTPAPRRRTAWGEEKGSQDVGLAAAEGVPDQADWNPAASLEQLRRSSLIEFEHLEKVLSPETEKKEPPMRAMPPSAALLPHSNSPRSSPVIGTPKPKAEEATFAARMKSASAGGKTVEPVVPKPMKPSPSIPMMEADVDGLAAKQRPIFTEPEFDVEQSMEAKAFLEGQGMLSPHERDVSP